jgi:uncharacterized UPF0160 family protein
MKKIATHSGAFHPDEIMAVATLTLWLDKEGESYEVIRTRDQKIIDKANFAVDVGGSYDPVLGRFDHHQEGGAGKRENGIPYSSIGIVWKAYGEKLVSAPAVWEGIDRRVAQPLDLHDNGVATYDLKKDGFGIHPYLLHHMTVAFRPTWKEGPNEDIQFAKLLEMFRELLRREIQCEEDRQEGIRLIKDAYAKGADKRVMVLDDNYPFDDIMASFPEVLFVVTPNRERNGWKGKAVLDDINTFSYRKYFPAAWAGKRAEEMAKSSGVPDAQFCHNHRFVIAAATKEGVLKLVDIALHT